MTSRPNVVLATVVGVIAVIGVVAGIVSATRHAPSYDAATPVGVVQAYLRAVITGDHRAAAELLATDSPCSVDDLDRAFLPRGVRVVLRDDRVDGDTAQVRVDVVMSSGGAFETAEYAERQTFRLTGTDGPWLITGTPWPMHGCGKEG